MHDPNQSADPPKGTGARNAAVAAGTPQDNAPSLFDAEQDEGRRRRDEGMRTAEHAAHPWVKDAIDQAITRWARTLAPFVADDIRDEVPILASSPNVLGARVSAAARKGLIRKTGMYRPSRAASRHGGVVAEWVGVGSDA
jgi:hypothetical protein